MIGTMAAFALVGTGCRRSPRGYTNAKERKLTVRARPGFKIAENTITMSTAPSNAPYTTYRGDIREYQGTELNAKYYREVKRPIP